MVSVVQLVRTPDCGSGGRQFESAHLPHIFIEVNSMKVNLRCPSCGHTWQWGYFKWCFKAPFHWVGFDPASCRPKDFRKTTCPKCKTKTWISNSK